MRFLLGSLLPLLACSKGSVSLDDSQPSQQDDSPATQDSEANDDSEATANSCTPTVSDNLIFAEEGDTVSFTVRCEGGEDPSVIEVLGLPSGASFQDGQFTWATGLADGGVYSLLFSAPGQGGPPRTAPAELQVADAWDASGNKKVAPALYTFEYGLPVLHIDAAGSIGSDYVSAEFTFQGQSHSGDIQLRGAASSYYPKVGYQIRLPDTDQLDLDEWGMGNKRRLVLLTTFDDNSYVRQALCYAAWAEMAKHAGDEDNRITPRTFFIVLFLEGEYHGLYLAIDRVDDEFLEQLGFDRSSSVYKAYNHDANFYSTNASGGNKSTWHDGYELKEGDSWTALNELVKFSATSSDQDFVDQAADWIEEDQFIDWYLFVRFASAGDSGGKNSYIVQDPSSGQFRYAPWDFNQSWGQDWRTLRLDSNIDEDFRWTNGIFAHYQDAAADRLQARWDELLATGPFREEWLRDQVDTMTAQIEPSARRDWDKWEDQYRSYGGWYWRTDFQDYDGELDYVYTWIEERPLWAALAGP